MLFSSLVFLYIFLPIVLILNYIIKKEYRNRLLLISSIIFFAWGGVSYTLILIFSLIVNYYTGRLIDKHRDQKKSKIILGIGVGINLLVLGVFKYADFVIENVNFVLNLLSIKTVHQPGIILPLGISFYTFQAMSYIIDVYRKEADVQKNFYKMALYISFFPQLIAGPIVRYQDIAKQLTNRKNHRANFVYGIQRFVIGLAKKVLIANQFGHIADLSFNIPTFDLNSSSAWIGVLAYTIQIYFDFSGYSDMAIGLGRMFGFKLPENFNYPYVSRSIREFWQRWHMTLSVWFKNYLYFPLGGSRKGETRTIVNLLIVFFATSIWHGASWNFVIWGMTHGFFMMLERLGLEKIVNRLWRPFQHFYALFIIVITRVFFRAPSFNYAWDYFKKLFAFDFSAIHIDIKPLVSTKVFFALTILAVLASTPIFKIINEKINQRIKSQETGLFGIVYSNSIQVIYSLMIVVFLLLSTMFLATDSYNPFIYFRF